MRIRVLVVLSAVAVSAMLWSCDSKESTGDNFDRTLMLQNVADNIILPQLTDLQSNVNALNAASDAFTAEVNESNLVKLQSAWIEAYTAWQHANAFNFGPGGEEGTKRRFVEEVGTFPVSEIKIESNIVNNNMSMTGSNRDARGFLAIEYLIFRVDEDNGTIVASFSAGFAWENRRAYLDAIVNKLKAQTDDVVTAWTSGYAQSFVTNNGKDVGSSTSLLYNEFVRSFESIKNFKVGLPAGLLAGQTQAEPELVEAYYSGISLAILKEHLSAIENIWYGRSAEGTDGIGFKEYLENVKGGDDLIASTEAQLVAVHAALNTLPADERLSEQVIDNATEVESFFDELQQHTRYFKSDMSSLLGISITYASGDGD